MSYKSVSLTPEIANIVLDKGTEAPHSGETVNYQGKGTYLCRQCGLGVFRATSQFHSGCGWPSFDAEIAGNVVQKPDADGRRTEILCARCGAHFGHVFMGEQFTPANTRHCVNALSLDLVSESEVQDTEEAIFAAGCFWGVEYYFKRLPGVLKTEVGYTGGQVEYPSYEAICTGSTGHYEAIRVIYDPRKVSYKDITKYFFEIHDPTQSDGQGPDRGAQYLSAIFCYDDNQANIATSLIEQLNEAGYNIATMLEPVSVFWPAETYHQDYYQKNQHAPYCHGYTKRFK